MSSSHLKKSMMDLLFLNNWTTITELRSIRKRLSEFEAYLDQNNIQNAQFA